jgi:hypothetical protein
MHSLRRIAIIGTRRTEGTEAARELAKHHPDSGTIEIYDDKGLGEKDITATRLGEVTLSRDEICKIFHIVVYLLSHYFELCPFWLLNLTVVVSIKTR